MSATAVVPPPFVPAAFDTNVRELLFDDVAINDAPAYRRFTIKSASESKLVVLLGSSSSCIRFQERNENFLGTEVVSASAMFDGFNVISELVLESGASVDIVAVFSALPQSFPGVTTPSAPVVLHTGEISLVARAASAWTGATVDTPSSLAPPLQTLTLPFSAKVYLSSMLVHPTELQASVGPGTAKAFDVKVSNPSSKPLSFVLRLQTMLPKFLDLGLFEHENEDQELKFGAKYQLEARGSQSFGFVVRCDASSLSASAIAGQYNAVIQCDNLRDARNTTLIHVAIVVASESHAELVSVSDTALDFGDLHRGNSKFRVVTFFNPSLREDASIRLSQARHNLKAEGSVVLLLDDVSVDEVTIPPLKYQRVAVQYTPAFSTDNDGQKVKFDVEVLVASGGLTQTMFLRAQAALFTSSITVNVSKVSFGDCQIGQTKRFPLTIENMSPLDSTVQLQLRSKIICIEGLGAKGPREWVEEVQLPAKGRITVTLQISPQRVNPTYRKQLTVTNLSNRRERFTIEIEANNMAPSEAKVHDALYTWECGIDTNAPLTAVSNSPLIVPYTIRSKSQTPLALGFTLTCAEMSVFVLDVDNEARQQFEAVAAELSALLKVMDDATLATLSPERAGVLRDEVNSVLQNRGRQIDGMTLEPLQKLTLYIRILRSLDAVKFHSKEDGLNIHLEGIETRRFVRISYQLCATRFVIEQQRAKNFGEVSIGERRTTKFQLTNPSKVPLFFSAAKSRSVTASHLRIEGVPAEKVVFYGFIGPHGRKDIDITFVPGIKGNFSETIMVSNLMDPANHAQISIKAIVKKPETFDVCPGSWSFGEIVAGDETPRATKFAVTNTSRSRRDFRFRLDGTEKFFFRLDGAECRVSLEVEHSAARSGSSRKIEEQFDLIEKKLKIYIRKGKKDKVESATRRLEVLRRALRGEEVDLAAADDGMELSELSGDESSSRGASTKKRYHHTELMQLLTRDGVPLPNLGPGEQANLVLAVSCVTAPSAALPPFQTTSINLVFFEASDHELQKSVPLDLTLTSALLFPQTAKHTTAPTAVSSLLTLLPHPSSGPFGMYGDTLLVPLHNALLHDPVMFRFSISASADTAFVILEPIRCGGVIQGCFDARFQFTPRNGQVRAGEVVTITVECTAKCLGPQRFFIPIKNLKNANENRFLAVELNPTLEADYFDLETKLLDFGTMITPMIDLRKGPGSPVLVPASSNAFSSPAKPFYLRNRTSKSLTLLVRSNKPSQILLFEDVGESFPLENPVTLAPKASSRLYAKFVPSKQCDTMQARTVVGGVLIEAIDIVGDSYSVCSSATLKIQAVVGSGMLRLMSPASVDLGTLPPTEKSVTVAIRIANPSRRISIAYSVEFSQNLTPESRSDGAGMLSPMQEKNFTFTLKLNNGGLYNEWVTVRNGSCDDNPIHVQVTCLKQDGTVSMTPADLLFPIMPIERVEGEWRIVPLTISSQITNHGSRDYVLVANVSVPVAIDAALNTDVISQRQGGRVRVDAKQTRKLVWTLFKPPELSAKDEAALAELGAVNVSTIAQIDVAQVIDETTLSSSRLPSLFRSKAPQPIVGQCVLKPRIGLQFAISEGDVEPKTIDIGMLGLHKRFSDKIAFTLTNRSGLLPLVINIECEPTIRFSVNKVTVEPSKSLTIDAQLDSKLLRAQGTFRIPVFFVNGSNHENEICSIVSGRYFSKMFRVVAADAVAGFADEAPSQQSSAVTVGGGAGVQGGASSSGGIHHHHHSTTDKITLPTIRIVDLTTLDNDSVLVDAKLTVTSTEQAVVPSVECSVDPKLESLLHLQMLSYDASSVVEQIHFTSTKSETVRLRLTLLKCHLGRLTAAFFGSRNLKVLLLTKFDDLFQIASGGTVIGENASSSISSTNSTNKGRIAGTASSTSTWLGSVRLHNEVTEDQDVQISGSLEAFTTFSCDLPSSKTLVLKASKDGKVFSGKLTVSNSFSAHTVSLVAHTIFRTEDGGCAISTEVSAASASSSASSLRPFLDVTPRQIVIEPKKSVVINVTVASTRDASFLDSCALLLIDENVQCGYATVRMSAAPSDVVEQPDAFADEQDEGGGSPAATGERRGNSPFEATSARREPGETSNVGMVLELLQCTPAPGDEGSYTFNTVCVKDGDQPPIDIRILNRSSSTAVEFSVSIVTQNPVPWITNASASLSTTAAASVTRIKPGESLPLKFTVLTGESGSFVAHVAITVSQLPAETLFLKLSCDILASGGGAEGIYDVLCTNGSGTRVPSSQPLLVSAGKCYGDGMLKVNLLEIVNRSNIPLEFPINIVRPFRVQVSQRRDASSWGNAGTAEGSNKGGVSSNNSSSISFGVSPPALSDANPLGLLATVRAPVSGGPLSTPTSITAASSTTNSSGSDSSSLFECKVAVCLHTQVGPSSHQASVVLEPKGKVRLVTCVSIERTRLAPDAQLTVEVDIFLKCKTVRESQHAVRLTFDVFAPTFRILEPFPVFSPAVMQRRLHVAAATGSNCTVSSLTAIAESPVLQITKSVDENCFIVTILRDRLAAVAEARSASVETIAFEEHLFVFSSYDASERTFVPIAYNGGVSSSSSAPAVSTGGTTTMVSSSSSISVGLLRPLFSTGVELERRAHMFARQLAMALSVKEVTSTSAAAVAGSFSSSPPSSMDALAPPSAPSVGPTALIESQPSGSAAEYGEGGEHDLSELVRSGLLHELQFLADECAFFLSYRYSRTIVVVCHFIAATVLTHRLVRTIRKKSTASSASASVFVVPRELEVLKQFVAVVEALPFTDASKF